MFNIELPCLPLIIERHINNVKSLGIEYKNPELDIDVFTQVWGSTALGFGGIGGQAMTKAYTTVISDNYTLYYSVFFGNRLAYTIHNPSDIFFNDLAKRNMEPVYKSMIYKKK